MTDSEGYKAVDYSKVTALLTEAMKQQQKQIEQLQAQLNASNTNNAELVKEMASIKNLILSLTKKTNSNSRRRVNKYFSKTI